jgi:D-threonine aldolase
LQCGSYIFMDADYGRNLDRDGAPTKAFEPSLFVWATVMSRPTEDRAIADAGLKALAFDSGPPLVCDEPAATYERASDEHGRLGIKGATNRLRIGDKMRLVPGRCDLTVNLYDWYVAFRGNRVEQLWPITCGSSPGCGEAGLPRDVSRLPHAARRHGCGSCSLRRDTGLTSMSASCWRACARS